MALTRETPTQGSMRCFIRSEYPLFGVSQILMKDGPVARVDSSKNCRPRPTSTCWRSTMLSSHQVARQAALLSSLRNGQRLNGNCSTGYRSKRRSPASTSRSMPFRSRRDLRSSLAYSASKEKYSGVPKSSVLPRPKPMRGLAPLSAASVPKKVSL